MMDNGSMADLKSFAAAGSEKLRISGVAKAGANAKGTAAGASMMKYLTFWLTDKQLACE